MVTIIISQGIRIGLLTIPEIIYVHCRRGHSQVKNIVKSERSTKWSFCTTVNILSVDISQVIRYVVIDRIIAFLRNKIYVSLVIYNSDDL